MVGQLDLKDAKVGLALVLNTAERVEEFISDIGEILKAGRLSKKDGERL